MTNEAQNQNTAPQAVPAQPVKPVAAQPVPAAKAAINAGTPVEEQGTAPAPQPFKIDRLGQNKHFSYTDQNGYAWDYEFQFPGMKRMLEIYDDARMSNGSLANSILWGDYLKDVVVKPAGLTLDSFNTRPGFTEVINAVDEFCNERTEG